MQTEILTVAFVAALTAFFRARGIAENRALVLAFAVSVFVAVAPLIAALLPPAQPFLQVLLQIIVLFLGAAGAYDLIVDLKTR